MHKYLAFFKTAYITELKNPYMIVMRLVMLTLLVFVTQQLWLVIGHKGFEPVNIVWYLVMNEMLFFSYDGKMQKKIHNDIRSGNVGYSLIRPFSYLSQCITESTGMFLARIPFLMVGGGIIAYLLTGGGLPTTYWGIPVALLLMLVSGIFFNTSQVVIGLLGLYMQNTHSVAMIFQKFMFLLGGLLFPITVYPQWLQDIAAWTPFPWAVYEVSRLVYEFNWGIVFNTAAHLIMWTVATFILAYVIFKQLLKKVSVNGG
ncbi:MAG: ABC-2 family transporter protein [Dysgonamonadaceae bacterium]|jgi:ABC-2 type transport system permease protein|nr:ABC-2 family transporter protein [Dysgonamonadaceae bacterium]